MITSYILFSKQFEPINKDSSRQIHFTYPRRSYAQNENTSFQYKINFIKTFEQLNKNSSKSNNQQPSKIQQNNKIKKITKTNTTKNNYNKKRRQYTTRTNISSFNIS